jgi:hypothetical protein
MQLERLAQRLPNRSVRVYQQQPAGRLAHAPPGSDDDDDDDDDDAPVFDLAKFI